MAAVDNGRAAASSRAPQAPDEAPRHAQGTAGPFARTCRQRVDYSAAPDRGRAGDEAATVRAAEEVALELSSRSSIRGSTHGISTTVKQAKTMVGRRSGGWDILDEVIASIVCSTARRRSIAWASRRSSGADRGQGVQLQRWLRRVQRAFDGDNGGARAALAGSAARARYDDEHEHF